MDQDAMSQLGPAETEISFTNMKVLLVADPRNYYSQETLKDGTAITIRAIRKDDKKSS